jgi:hypothetical protein
MKIRLHLLKNRSFNKNFILAFALVVSLVQVQAQNEVYWREGFELGGLTPCAFPSSAPVAPIPAGVELASNAGSWFVYGAYRTTGSACGSPYGADHVRFTKNVGATDSAYIITPVVDFGIKECHITRVRASRSISIWVTSETTITPTTNWSIVTVTPTLITNLCTDTTILVNSPTAKRLRIVSKANLDNDIDSVWLTSYSIIPVEMVSFIGKKNNKVNELTWTTASELNNKGYQIERSQGLEDNWQAIGFVGAKGKAASYSFQDANVENASTFYYRLRQMDYDGKETISKVIAISDNIKTKLNIYPSVTTGLLTVEAEENSAFQVVNLLGQTILSGKTTQRLDVSALPQGTYILKVGSEQTKFIKR